MPDDLCYLCLGAPAAKIAHGYNVHVCTPCWQGAEGGWPKSREAALFSALERGGLLIPDRNERGLLPRVYSPPSDHAL